MTALIMQFRLICLLDWGYLWLCSCNKGNCPQINRTISCCRKKSYVFFLLGLTEYFIQWIKFWVYHWQPFHSIQIGPFCGPLLRPFLAFLGNFLSPFFNTFNDIILFIFRSNRICPSMDQQALGLLVAAFADLPDPNWKNLQNWCSSITAGNASKNR